MGGSVKDLKSEEELDQLLKGGAPVILHFWASWCEASKQMDNVFSHLSIDFPHSNFFRVEAEELPEISERYSVSAVPYFVFIKKGNTVDTLEGANPSTLAKKVAEVAGPSNMTEVATSASIGMAAGPAVLETVKKLAKENGSSSQSENSKSGVSVSLKERLHKLVDSHPVFLFMKGNPEQPKCGFSQKVVQVLKGEGIQFGSFDILTDDEVREGMKKFSNWPTYPQLFCKGELLGGCDIVIAMHESGELKEVFRGHGIFPMSDRSEKAPEGLEGGISGASSFLNANLTSRLKDLINSNPVTLFMKGSKEEPECGFSRKALEILQQEKVEFGSFDVLADNELREGLKVLSNCYSYPQLYVTGQLIGGFDTMLEMHKNGELRRLLIEKGVLPKQSLEDRLKNLLSSSQTMLFMKGTPDAPRCGFSSKVVNALKGDGVEFGHFDILTDDKVRQGLKAYSNWPTYPQLYHKGELIGGCDIVLELHNAGELKSSLQ